MAEDAWKPGDRVEVCLPDRDLPRRRGGAAGMAWVNGTVREVDPPGNQPGVVVDLDYPVNGVHDCFATHAELRRAAPEEDENREH